ncbi:MAG: PspC domain-containing protein [Desulfovibrio sp.]|nr:MAG: PspC domain-containing protein [Desulfovibrio sp.]
MGGSGRGSRRNTDGSRRGPYRSRQGLIMGVCRGLADYLEFPVMFIRLMVVVLWIATGFWVVAALYLLAAVIMKFEPVLPIDDEQEQEFYDSYAGSSRKSALSRLKRKFDTLDRRLQNMEDIVTKRDFQWDSKLGK